jgi:hypothetical protein
MRTSSTTKVGADKDSDKWQRAAIAGYAKAVGYVIVDWFYDKAVRGSDAITDRAGFAAMLERTHRRSADRAVQLAARSDTSCSPNRMIARPASVGGDQCRPRCAACRSESASCSPNWVCGLSLHGCRQAMTCAAMDRRKSPAA